MRLEGTFGEEAVTLTGPGLRPPAGQEVLPGVLAAPSPRPGVRRVLPGPPVVIHNPGAYIQPRRKDALPKCFPGRWPGQPAAPSPA